MVGLAKAHPNYNLLHYSYVKDDLFCSVNFIVYIYASVGEMMAEFSYVRYVYSHAGSSGIAMSSLNHGGYKETIIFTGLFSAHNQGNCITQQVVV